MKRRHFFSVAVFLLAVLILLMTLTNFNSSSALAKDSLAGRSVFHQFPMAAQAEDDSEIGSTDGIVVMGIVIVLIVTLPLIFNRKK